MFTVISAVMFVPPAYYVEFDDAPGELKLVDIKTKEKPAKPPQTKPAEPQISDKPLVIGEEHREMLKHLEETFGKERLDRIRELFKFLTDH